MRRKVAASMKPAPRPRKYFRNISFQCRRATTASPPATLAAAAAEPKRTLQARADLMRAEDDSTRQVGSQGKAYNVPLGQTLTWALVVSGAILCAPALAQDPVVSAPADAAETVARQAAEDSVAPTPGASTMSLAAAVATALKQNFGLLAAADTVATSRMHETVARAQFYPKLVPTYGQSAYGRAIELDVRQKLPWTGATLSAGAAFRSSIDDAVALPRTSDARFVLTQPLLRGLGPNAAHYDMRNSERGRESQERTFELTRQRVAIQVTTAFYQVILQRQLLAVARQSLRRSESLLSASEARLQVGLVSKLDVFRAELQASQAQESMVRAETSLQNALESFRSTLGLAATEPVEPEAVELPDIAATEPLEPIEVLVARGQQARIDLA